MLTSTTPLTTAISFRLILLLRNTFFRLVYRLAKPPIGDRMLSRGRTIIRVHQFFNWHGNMPAVRFKLDLDELRQNLTPHYNSGTFHCAHACLAVRQVGLEITVGAVFVSQAAHQSATPTGNLDGVKGGFLLLGCPHGDWLEYFQEGLAAAMLAALLIISDKFSLIT